MPKDDSIHHHILTNLVSIHHRITVKVESIHHHIMPEADVIHHHFTAKVDSVHHHIIAKVDNIHHLRKSQKLFTSKLCTLPSKYLHPEIHSGRRREIARLPNEERTHEDAHLQTSRLCGPALVIPPYLDFIYNKEAEIWARFPYMGTYRCCTGHRGFKRYSDLISILYGIRVAH